MASIATVPTQFEQLRSLIAEKTATVGVVGLGYVGLPLINAFVNAGFHCLGFDVDAKKVDLLKQGRSYIEHIPSDIISAWLDKKQFDATAEMARLAEADVILICVPTPLNSSRDPDLSYVEGTAQMVAKALRPGQG